MQKLHREQGIKHLVAAGEGAVAAVGPGPPTPPPADAPRAAGDTSALLQALADVAGPGSMLIGMMRKAGYPAEYSAALTAATAIVGPIIPPSIGFIVFGVAANLSISKLFLAGIVPGLLIGLSLVVAWWWAARNEDLTPPPRKSMKEVMATLIDGIWALMLPLIIIFGLKFGIFTPTEAAVVCAVYSLFVAVFIYRELKISQIYEVFVTAAKTDRKSVV